MNFNTLIGVYPKKRLELPQSYQDIYDDHYKSNRGGNSGMVSISSKLEQWMHKKVAHVKNDNSSILEIGAGTLNHVKFEENYSSYDVIEPFVQLYEDSSEVQKINHIYSDVFDIEGNKKYDKICSVAVFEHLEELPFIISKLIELLNNPRFVLSCNLNLDSLY